MPWLLFFMANFYEALIDNDVAEENYIQRCI